MSNGSRVIITEPWIAAVWWRPLGILFSVVMPVGFVWSIWNLRKKTGRIANAMALALGILWMVLAFMNILDSIIF